MANRAIYGFQKRKRPSAMPNSSQLPDHDDSLSSRVFGDQVRLLAINQLDERLERYRLAQPKLDQQMLKSLRDYGQLSPVVVCQLDGQTVLVDGFKRRHPDSGTALDPVAARQPERCHAKCNAGGPHFA